MSRYKFRGKSQWTIEELDAHEIKHVNGWVYGNLIENGDRPFIVGDIVDVDSEYIAHEWWMSVHPESIGQYTGLKDKQGMGIYEGDIVNYSHGEYSFTAIVERDYWYWYLKGVEPKDSFSFDDIADKTDAGCTVFGNTYDNKELLKVDNQ